MNKLQLVKKVLESSKDIRDWYVNEIGIDIEEFTAYNVREYGLDGKGNIADMIISDGIMGKIITIEDEEEE